MEWTSEVIRIWFFPPDAVPASLIDGEAPDPTEFGTPSASFSGSCSASFGEKFFNHSIIIDTSFCGGWAGSTFGTGTTSCPLIQDLGHVDSCISYVANNPQDFVDVYWEINSIEVWEKVSGYAEPNTRATPTSLVLEILSTLVKEPVSTSTLGLRISPLTGGVLTLGENDQVLDSTTIPRFTAVLGPLSLSTPKSILLDVFSTKTTAHTVTVSQSTKTLVRNPYETPVPIPFGTWNTEGKSNLFPPGLSFAFPSQAGLGSVVPDGNFGVGASVVSSFITTVLTPPAVTSVVDILVASTFVPVPIAESSGSTPLPRSSRLPFPRISPPFTLPRPLPAWSPDTSPFPINPVLPPNGNPGIVPPRPKENPISDLWGTFGANLQNQILSAAKNVPTPLPAEPIIPAPLNVVAAPLDGTVSPPIAPVPAASIPVAPVPVAPAPVVQVPEAPVPEVPVPAPLIPGAPVPVAPVTPLPNLPNPQTLPSLGTVPKPATGLFGFLDPATRNKLRNMFVLTPPEDTSTGPGVGRLQVPKNDDSVPGDFETASIDAPASGGLLVPEPAQGLDAPLQENTGLKPTPGLSTFQGPSKYAMASDPLAFDLLPGPQVPPGQVQNPAVDSPLVVPVASKTVVASSLFAPSQALTLPGVVANIVPAAPPIAPAASLPGQLQAAANNLLAGLTLAVPQIQGVPPPSTLGTLPVVNPVPQPLNLTITPNVPVTALNTTDTTQAMSGLLKFLDDDTKAQIVDLLVPDEGSTMAVARHTDLEANTDDAESNDAVSDTILYPHPETNWETVADTLSPDTHSKLNDIVHRIANLDQAGIAPLTGNLFDALRSGEILPIKDDINGINVTDQKKLLSWLTDSLHNIVLHLDDSTPLQRTHSMAQEAHFQDVIDTAKWYVERPDAERMASFMESVKDASSSFSGASDPRSKRSTKRQSIAQSIAPATSWTPQDKVYLAQSVYTLCPSPALIGIYFPSVNDLAADLLSPSSTVESALDTFKGKLQAYFDVAVQGCWTKLNQWLALRQLLRRQGSKGTISILGGGFRAARMRVRQEPVAANDGYSYDDVKGLLEQKISTLCPGPDGGFSPAGLIADLESGSTSLEADVSAFQRQILAYMAKLQTCFSEINTYASQLKELADPASDGAYTVNGGGNGLVARQDIAALKDLSPVDIVDLLATGPTGIAYASLTPEEQHKVYEVLLISLSQGTSESKEELQDLALQLIGALQGPQESWGFGKLPGDVPSNDQMPSDETPEEEVPPGFAPGDGVDDDSDDRGGDDDDDDGKMAKRWVQVGDERPFIKVHQAQDSDRKTPSPTNAIADSFKSIVGHNFKGAVLDVPPPYQNLGMPFTIRERLALLHSRFHRRHAQQPPDALSDNGVIPDADAPKDLDKILGKHGTLDPYGMLGPQTAATDGSATDTTSPNGLPGPAGQLNTWTFDDLPSSSVDQASSELDKVVDQLGELDPYGELGPQIKGGVGGSNGDAGAARSEYKAAEKAYLGRLKQDESGGFGDRFLGDPVDVKEFVQKFFTRGGL